MQLALYSQGITFKSEEQALLLYRQFYSKELLKETELFFRSYSVGNPMFSPLFDCHLPVTNSFKNGCLFFFSDFCM